LTARAQRGPQWDVASQQFMVDKGSDLYYNYAALMEIHKDKDEDALRQRQQQENFQQNVLQAQQMQLQQSRQNIHLSDAEAHSARQQYNPNPYQNPNSIVQLQQAPEHTPMVGMQGGGMGMAGFGPDVYIPPDIRTNPRRTTRAGGGNGQQGFYRV